MKSNPSHKRKIYFTVALLGLEMVFQISFFFFKEKLNIQIINVKYSDFQEYV